MPFHYKWLLLESPSLLNCALAGTLAPLPATHHVEVTLLSGVAMLEAWPVLFLMNQRSLLISQVAKQVSLVHTVLQHLLKTAFHNCNIFMVDHAVSLFTVLVLLLSGMP